MNEILLSGLIGSHPLGAMAAFGLLRSCWMIAEFGEVRLSWRFGHDCVAVLHTANDCTCDELLMMLVDRQVDRHTAAFLTWSDDINQPPDVFRGQLRPTLDNPTPEGRETADFFASFGSEAITYYKQKVKADLVKPTGFHMTAGQQKFIKSAKELARSLDPSVPGATQQKSGQRRAQCREAFQEALFGPWCYRDSEHCLGWDPSAESLHALSAIAPTAAGPASVRAAVWLAFESLPLFPCVAVGSVLRTAGFDDTGKHFVWPIWEPAITLPTVRSLLTAPLLHADPPNTIELGGLGVRAVYASRCLRDANGRGTLRNAELIVHADQPGTNLVSVNAT